jgi:hypothetical protein
MIQLALVTHHLSSVADANLHGHRDQRYQTDPPPCHLATLRGGLGVGVAQDTEKSLMGKDHDQLFMCIVVYV